MKNLKIKNEHTLVDWCNFIRNVMTREIWNRPKIGSVGRKVQIDESLFRRRRKYHCGRYLLGDVDADNNVDATFRRRNYGERVNGP